MPLLEIPRSRLDKSWDQPFLAKCIGVTTVSEKLILSITSLASKLTLGLRPKSVLLHPPELNAQFAEYADSEYMPIEMGITFQVLTPEFRIGRSTDTSDLVIRGDRDLSLQVSRTHVTIVAVPGKSHELRNETETSKTYLNGKELEPRETVPIGYSEKIDIAGGLCVIECVDSEATQVSTALSREGLMLSLAGDRVLWQTEQEEKKIKLSPAEFRLLHCLMEHAQEAISYEDILAKGFDELIAEATADEADYAIKNLQTVKSRLQNKLEAIDEDSLYIESVSKWGSRKAGYKFYRH